MEVRKCVPLPGRKFIDVDYRCDECGAEVLRAVLRERVRELPPGVDYMPKPWQPLNVLIAAEQALAPAQGKLMSLF
jgi:hypothetical protein